MKKKKKKLKEEIQEFDEIAESFQEDEEFIRKKSIQNQITRGVASVLGVVSTLAAVIVFLFGRYYITHDSGNRFEDIAHSNVLSLEQNLKNRSLVLGQISDNISLKIKSNSPEKEIEDSINTLQLKLPDIEGVWVISPAGKIVGYNRLKLNESTMNWGGLIDGNYGNEEWFYKCKTSKTSQFYAGNSGLDLEKANLPKNTIVWTESMKSGGCLVAFDNMLLIAQDLQRKNNYIRKSLKLKSVQTHIISSDGSVLYSTDSEWSRYINSGENYNPLMHYFKALPSGHGSADVHGNKVIFAWANIKDFLTETEPLFLNGYVVSQVRYSEITLPLYYLVLTLLLLIVFVTGVASYMAYTKSKTLVHNPILDLEETLEKVGDGDLSIKNIRIPDNNDIGFLAYSMNKMVSKYREMLHMIMDNGKNVVKEGRRFFINLGRMQSTSLKIVSLVHDAATYIEKVTQISSIILENAGNQQTLALKNRQTMDELRGSYEDSATKREAITGEARNVVQKSNLGLQTIDDFATTVEKISDSSKKIKGIISIIDDISDQTNLLALNASIEAARAGVHGQGFSVVANEISDLAKRSARSAEEISSLIKDTVSQVQVVTEKVDNAKNFFKQITDMMHHLDKGIIEMADTTSRQEVSVMETADRAKLVAEYSSKITANTKEQTETSEQLIKLIKEIEKLSNLSQKDIEKDDQMLQVFMDKIYELMETAKKFKVEEGSVLDLEQIESEIEDSLETPAVKPVEMAG